MLFPCEVEFMISRHLLTLLLASSATAAFAAVTAEEQLSSVPVADRYATQAVVQNDKLAAPERFRGSKSAAYRITAAAWDSSVVEASKKARAADGDKAKPLQIGFSRAVDAQVVPMTSLAWETLADGSKVASIDIKAAEAAGLRASYQIDGPANGLEVRFAGSGRDEIYLGDVKRGETLWSPVLEGDSATLELRVLPGFAPSQYAVRVEQLSHLLIVGAAIGSNKDSRDIGDSGSCNIDVACVSNPSQALLDAARAVAKIVFSDNGGTYLCSGTLLNSAPTSGVPYFYTASHCIDSQAAASTMNSYWFFDAVSCNSLAIPPYQLVTGGATLLVTDMTMDVTLLQMRSSPPNGAVLAAWSATVIPTGANVVGLHHPSGDLKKFSQGNMIGYTQGPAAYGSTPRLQYGKDSFITVRWVDGTTEGGSSGSGLFTFNSNCGGGSACYQLRGGLEGGAASCSNRNGPDRYSRMDLLYTRLSPWLQPAAAIPVSNGSVSSMVEYYMPQFDYYFMTTREGEKTSLDTLRDGNSNPYFYRTGYWFKTDTNPSANTNSLTRYFIPGVARGGTRGTHFYTALNSDKIAITSTGKERFSTGCAGVPNTYFCNEGIDSYIAIPSGTGASATCFAGETPIYRVYRGTPNYVDDGNHRYLTSLAMYNYMVSDQGWNGEFVNFCAKQ